MTRIAVTGASGFIGAHLVDRLLADGHTVVALLRHESQSTGLEERGVEVTRGDVTDRLRSRARSPVVASSFTWRAPGRTAAFLFASWKG